MMNFAMMTLATMNPATTSSAGVMVGVMGPALGVLAAVAVAGLAYGFATLAIAALHRDGRPARDRQAAPALPVRSAAWEMTPKIALLLRSASDESRARGERAAMPQRISSPRAAV